MSSFGRRQRRKTGHSSTKNLLEFVLPENERGDIFGFNRRRVIERFRERSKVPGLLPGGPTMGLVALALILLCDDDRQCRESEENITLVVNLLNTCSDPFDAALVHADRLAAGMTREESLLAPARANAVRIVYGVGCTWWGTVDMAGVHSEAQLPCCPHCSSMLFEVEPKVWWEGVDGRDAEEEPGYRKYIEWLRGKCFKTAEAAREAYAKATAS